MFRPVGEVDSLPSDVAELAGTVRENFSPPNVGVGLLDYAASPRALRMPIEIAGGDGISFAPTGGGLTVESQNEAPKLEHWTVRAKIYSSEIAGKIGLLAGLFGGGGKRASAGVIHEAKRFRVDSTTEDREVEVGVAVRLLVATTDWSLDAEASIPNIAAAFQLSMQKGEARIAIDVAGYGGPLGDLLPAPQHLDVSTLADYLNSFKQVQAQVFGTSGLPFLIPTVLNYDDLDSRGEGDGSAQ